MDLPAFDLQQLFREYLGYRTEARRAAEAGTKAMAEGKRGKARAELRQAERAIAAAEQIERRLNPSGAHDSSGRSTRGKR